MGSQSFDGADGKNPSGGVIADAAGDLFGVTSEGGASDDGVIYEIAKTSGGYATTPTVLISFDGSDGQSPVGPLVADAAGDLFGVTSEGGSNGGGTVFEIAKTSAGYASTPTILANLSDSPDAGLAIDAAGDLFGTTSGGGTDNDGTAFEIAKTAAGYAASPQTLVSFVGEDGDTVEGISGLVLDAKGDLFGELTQGLVFAHQYNSSLFEIAKTRAGYAGAAATLYNLDGTTVGVAADAAGDLFAEDSVGVVGGESSVFELPVSGSGYASTPTTLVFFPFADGIFPEDGVTLDSAGDLFGAETGGATGSEAYEIVKTAAGYSSTATVLSSISGDVTGTLLVGAAGDLFGATVNGGAGDGSVFELTAGNTVPPTLTIADSSPLPDSTTQTLTGTIDAADAGQTISIYDGFTLVGTTTADAAGSWSVTVALPATGPHVLTAQANNGNFGISNAVELASGGGQTIDLAATNDAASVYDTSGDPDSLYGPGGGGTFYLTSAQVVSFASGATIDFVGGSGNSADLESTGGEWDIVNGNDATVDLLQANAEINGSGNVVAFAAFTEAAVAFYNSGSNWNYVYGDDGLIVLTQANAGITGGGDTIYFEGSGENAAALYDTGVHWDALAGSNGEIVLTAAFAEVIGGGNAIYFEGASGNAAALYNTGDVLDAITGSNGEVVLTAAFAEVTGGGNAVYFEGASGNAATLYNTGGVFDGVTGSNGEVVLTNAQAEVAGGGNSIYLVGAAANTAALYNTGTNADAVTGSNNLLVLTNAQATVTGSVNTIYLVGANTVTQSGASDAFVFQPTIGEDTINGFASTDTMRFSAADFANFAALQSHMSQSGANTVIALDATDTVTLTNVLATSLSASQFHFV